MENFSICKTYNQTDYLHNIFVVWFSTFYFVTTINLSHVYVFDNLFSINEMNKQIQLTEVKKIQIFSFSPISDWLHVLLF